MSDNKSVCVHDWETGRWGVIIGVSRCRICGVRSRSEDFAKPAPPPAEEREENDPAIASALKQMDEWVAWIDQLGILGWDNGRGPRVDNLPRATPEEGTPA